MSDLSDDFKFMKEISRKKKARNKEFSVAYLFNAGIPFDTRNGGIHLIVECEDSYIDFWPTTGKWITRKEGLTGRGVKKLVKWIKGG